MHHKTLVQYVKDKFTAGDQTKLEKFGFNKISEPVYCAVKRDTGNFSSKTASAFFSAHNGPVAWNDFHEAMIVSRPIL